jgi:hypothetical protein
VPTRRPSPDSPQMRTSASPGSLAPPVERDPDSIRPRASALRDVREPGLGFGLSRWSARTAPGGTTLTGCSTWTPILFAC